MSDSNFLRYYISAQNGWNPFDESVKKIPSIYWTMAYHIKRMNEYVDQEYKLKPVAELLANIIAPENYSSYVKWKEDSKKNDNGMRTTKTKNGEAGSGSSEVHFEPGKGMVDDNGKIIIPEKLLQQHSDTSDVIITG